MKWLVLLLLLLAACSLFKPKSDVEKFQEKIDNLLEKNPIYLNSQLCVLTDKGDVIQTECVPELVVSKNETAIVAELCDGQNCTRIAHAIVSIPKPAGLALVDNSRVVMAMTCGLLYEHTELNKTRRYEVVKADDFGRAFEFTLDDCKKHGELFSTLCIQCIAVTEQNPEICKEITLKGLWSSPTDECIAVVSRFGNNTKGCNEIRDEELRESCIRGIEGIVQ
ncbi:MAG: hypothetical protein QXR48_02000 [Candidatus Woesearchaeota archaeon]